MTTEFDQRFNTAQAGGMNAAFVGGVGGEAIMGRRPPSREGLEEEGASHKAQAAEEVARAGFVSQEEVHRDQIYDYCGNSIEVVLRLSSNSRMVSHRQLLYF